MLSMAYSPGRNLVPSPSWQPSVEKKCAQSCSSVSAEPAVIDVMVYPVEGPTATEHNPQHDVSSYRPTSAAEADQTDPINKKS